MDVHAQGGEAAFRNNLPLTGFSETSESALPHVVESAGKPGAQSHALHVIPHAGMA